MGKRTRWYQLNYDQALIDTFCDQFDLSPTGAKILINRGIETVEDAERFLNVKLAHLFDPFLLTNMDQTIDRIIQAFDRGEKIVGFGDYDVDGLTSLSILCLFMKAVYQEINYVVPNRQSSGYGLNNKIIDQIHAMGADLIITVDCGISNLHEITYANELGIDVIVIDHHQIPDELPPAVSILDPYLKDDQFPYPHMAAVGVTFNMLVALRKKLRDRGHFNDRPEIDLRTYLDIVAIGTVADIVPLHSENRIFTKIGFQQMAKTQHVGLRALMAVSGVEPPIDSIKIGFKIAPRINAAGRMSDATKVVELFTTSDPKRAEEIAQDLDEENTRRQETERAIYQDITLFIDSKKLQDTAIIFANEAWHPGVIGIVAAKVVERYNRPTFLFSVSNGIGRGSARSINGFDLYKNLSKQKALFINYGGHKYAAGMSIDMENFDLFKEQMQHCSNTFFADPENLVQEISIDDLIDIRDVNLPLYNEIQRFAPFGHHNPEPVFGMKNIFPVNARIVAERHLKIRLSAQHIYFNAIGFNLSHLINQTRSYVDLLFTVQLSSWRGNTQLQLNLKDLKKHDKSNFSLH